MANLKDTHRYHPKEIIPMPFAGQGPGRHYGKIVCRLCGTFVAWADKNKVNQLGKKLDDGR